MNKEVIDFINEYGYSISQTYNYNDTLLFYLDQLSIDYNDKNYHWLPEILSDFINKLFLFNKNSDVILQDYCQNPIFEDNHGYYFSTVDSSFHIFYFNKDNIYLCEYNKSSMFRKITRDQIPYDCSVITVQIHKLEYVPRLNDIYQHISDSFILYSVILKFLYKPNYEFKDYFVGNDVRDIVTSFLTVNGVNDKTIEKNIKKITYLIDKYEYFLNFIKTKCDK